MKVIVEKCCFAQSEVKVLRHIVNRNGILPKLEKVKVIQKLTPPRDVTGVNVRCEGTYLCGKGKVYRNLVNSTDGDDDSEKSRTELDEWMYV